MVYIIVLNWNGWKDTIACLESLMGLDYPEYKVVICDNDSSDDSVAKIQAWYQQNNTRFSYLNNADYQYLDKVDVQSYQSNKGKGLYLLQTGDNLGFAGGNNVGIEFSLNQSDMSYTWILNNDTEVDKYALSTLVSESCTEANVGVCGSKLLYFDDRTQVQGIGGSFNFWTGTSRHYKKEIKTINSSTFGAVDYPVGASLLISKNCLDVVGKLSEDFFLYYEEVDYTMRTIEAGFSLKVTEKSIVYHKEGASINKSELSDFLYIKNKFLVTWKYHKISLPLLYCFLPLWSFNRLRKKELKKSMNCFIAAFTFLSLPK